MKLKAAFSIFSIIHLLFSPVMAAETPSLELEPLLIKKSKYYPLKAFCLDNGTFSALPAASTQEALGSLPVDLQSRSLKSAIQTDFSLRGSGFQDVLTLVDGQRVNDPQTAHHNSDIPFTKEDLEKIEVIPGASSSFFGPDAIGGAINFVTKKPRDQGGVFEAGFGQYKSEFGLLSLSRREGDLGLRFSVERDESGGFYPDTDFKKFIASGASCYDFPGGELDVSFGYLEKEFGAYDFYTPGRGFPSKEWTKTYLLNAGLEIKGGGFLIKPNLLFRRHYDKFLLDKTLVASNFLSHHRSDLFTPNVYFQRETEKLGKLGLGVESGEERINSTNLGKHSRWHNSIYLDDVNELNNSLSSNISYRFDKFETFGESHTGSLQLRYQVFLKQFVHAGISRSIRIPSFTELFYSDPVTVGNDGLGAEKAVTYEAGYDYQGKNFNAGLALFYRNEDGFIDWIKSSSAQARWQVENITQADVLGLEGSMHFILNQKVSIDTNYTYINKRIRDHGLLYKYGPNYAKHLLNTALVFDLPWGKINLGLTYKKRPVRRGWLILNPNLYYRLNSHSAVFVSTSNILNVEFQDIEGIPSPGRWVEAAYRLEW